MMILKVSLSQAFYNKNLIAGQTKAAYSNSFRAQTISIEEFFTHILRGCAWAVGVYRDNHRAQDGFLSSQILALDLDEFGVKDALKNPIIAQYAALIHPSPSDSVENPKCRVIFILEKPLQSRAKWEKAQRALYEQTLELRPDPACINDCARFYYGNDQNVAITDAVRVPNHILALDTIKTWLDKARDLPHQIMPAKPAPSDASLPEALTRAVINALKIDVSARATNGFIQSAAPCPAAAHEHDDTRPAFFWNIEKNFGKCFKCGVTYNTHQVAAMLGIDPAIYYPGRTTEDNKPPLAQLTATARALTNAIKGSDAAQIEKTAAQLQEALNALRQQEITQERPSAARLISAVYARYKEALTNPQPITGYQSGITALTKATGGLQPGGVYTFLGDTGVAKTTLTATMAVALLAQAPGYISSCESGAKQYIARMAAAMARVPWSAIGRGGYWRRAIHTDFGIRRAKLMWVLLSDDEKARIHRALSALLQLADKNQLRFCPLSTPSPDFLRRDIANEAREYGIRWVIMDSLNNYSLPFSAPEYENVSAAAVAAESIAVDSDLVVIATAQGGRNTKDRNDKRLGLHDARGSGVVEEKAFCLASIYNPWALVAAQELDESDIDHDEYPPGSAQINIHKLRDGLPNSRFLVEYVGGAGFYDWGA